MSLKPISCRLDYTPESIVAEEARLSLELDALKQAEDVSDISMRETVRDVVRLSELLKTGADSYDLASPQEKDRLIRAIFSELDLTENTLEYKCHRGFAALQSRFVASCDPTGWLSELWVQHPHILACIEMLNATLCHHRDPDGGMPERLVA